MHKKISVGLTITISIITLMVTALITTAVTMSIYSTLVADLPEREAMYSSLAEIIEKNDISPDECAVFGDGDNDVTMLSGFKNSYAAVWSKPSVKACASNIFDNIVNKIYEIQNR